MLSDLEILSRLLLAALLGSAIGFERERLLWAAGIRTHMLVCVGACLIMIVSAFGFADIIGAEHVVLDPSRVAAQVVSGIGFLGAGSIILRGNVIRGLTTAASIWAVAGIGLAIGGGLYFAGIATTVVMLVILAGLKPLEQMYRARNQSCNLHIKAEHGQLTPDLLKKTLHIRNNQLKRFLVRQTGKRGVDELDVSLARVSAEDMRHFARKLEALAMVRTVKTEKASL